MKMTNDMKLIIASMGKFFEVTHICRNVDEVNFVLSEWPDTAFISEDERGNLYVAKKEPIPLDEVFRK